MKNSIQLYDIKGIDAGSLTLTLGDLPQDVKPVTNAICARAIINNSKIATAATKGRSEIAYANKKPWKQKGTGRARASSARSPLWRGGGIVFGPTPDKRKLSCNRKMSQLALKGLFGKVIAEQKLVCVQASEADFAKPSTKVAAEILQKLRLAGKIENKRVAVFVSEEDKNLALSFKNIPEVSIEVYGRHDLVSLAKCWHWIIFEKDKTSFEQVVAKWN